MLSDFKGLKKGVIRLYKVWVLQEGGENAGSGTQRAFRKKRDMLEQEFTNLKLQQSSLTKN
jgi:hypothetical protein